LSKTFFSVSLKVVWFLVGEDVVVCEMRNEKNKIKLELYFFSFTTV
jgi:hypothetical protein